MKLRLLAGAAAASMLCASGAFAEPAPSGWYGAVDVGAQWAGDVKLSSFFLSTRVKSDVGYAVFGRVGYKVSPNFRIELEGGANSSTVSTITGSGANSFVALCAIGSAPGTCPSPRGGLTSWPIMVNGLWDFLGDRSRWDPFIGAGLGAAFVRLDSSGRVQQSCVGCAPVLATIEGDGTQFA